DEFVTAAHVPVQGGGDTVEFGGHGAHGHCFEAAAVGEADRRADDADPTQPRRTACPSCVATAALSRRAIIRRALSHRARPRSGAVLSPSSSRAPIRAARRANPASPMTWSTPAAIPAAVLDLPLSGAAAAPSACARPAQ